MITKNFIKQCEQAEEIQKEYIPIWSRVLVKPCWAVNINTWGVVTCAANEPRYCDVFMNGNQYGGIEIKDFIWLPTQEQLQKMILKIFSPFTKIIKFSEFASNYVKLYRDTKYEDLYWRDLYPTAIESMNELWLMYVMYEKYHKIWTGEKWVKADD